MATNLSLQSKLPNCGVNIFSYMGQVAAETDAINLAQGFPNFDCSPKLQALVTKYMETEENQYPPMPGVLKLRQRISEKISKLHGSTYDPETEITVTPGGHAALNGAINGIVHAGDEVILFEPAFDCFRPLIELAGGIPIPVKMCPPDQENNSWRIDWDEVVSKISQKTRAILINTPHNPTGFVFQPEDIAALIQIVRNTEIVVVSDEVYEHIIFDGIQHESVCRYPELAERSFAVFSFGKNYHATGWKTGYCVAPKELMKEFRKIYQMTVFCSNRPVQCAIAEFLDEEEEYQNLPEFYQAKRDFFLEHLKDSRFEILPASGTYFQSLCYKGILPGKDMDVAKQISADFKVTLLPISPFVGDGTDFQYLRVCFAKTEDVLEESARRLCKI